MDHVQQEAFDVLVRHLVESTIAMFDGYAMHVTPIDRENAPPIAPDEESVLASIGYAGEKFRGALVLVAPRGTIRSWLAATGDPGDDADVYDALGEFSNMLLGRLKGCLLSEGLPILLSTPTACSGTAMRLSRPAGAFASQPFMGPGWTFEVHLTATFEHEFAFAAPEPGPAAAEAGDMMLF